MRTASLDAMANLAIFGPRRIAMWKYLLRHSGSLRTVTCAASTSRKRSKELPCFVMRPSHRDGQTRCPIRLHVALRDSFVSTMQLSTREPAANEQLTF